VRGSRTSSDVESVTAYLCSALCSDCKSVLFLTLCNNLCVIFLSRDPINRESVTLCEPFVEESYLNASMALFVSYW